MRQSHCIIVGPHAINLIVNTHSDSVRNREGPPEGIEDLLSPVRGSEGSSSGPKGRVESSSDPKVESSPARKLRSLPEALPDCARTYRGHASLLWVVPIFTGTQTSAMHGTAVTRETRAV